MLNVNKIIITFFLGFISISIFFLIKEFNAQETLKGYYIIYFYFFFIISILFLINIFLKKILKIYFLIIFCSFIGSLYLLELYIFKIGNIKLIQLLVMMMRIFFLFQDFKTLKY